MDIFTEETCYTCKCDVIYEQVLFLHNTSGEEERAQVEGYRGSGDQVFNPAGDNQRLGNVLSDLLD